MFGRMENTNQAIELQITQEYTGQSRMLTYLGPMWEEVLKTDTGGAGPRGRGRRRHRAGPRGHRDRRRGQPRQRRQPDRPPLRAGEPVRLRPPGMGLEARLRGHRRGLGPDDVEQRRRASVDTIVRDDDGLVGGARELPDAARRRAPVPVQRPLRAQARTSGSSRTTGAPSTTTRPTAQGSASTAPPPAATSSRSTSRRSSSATGTSRRRPENLLMWFHHVPWDRRMDSGRLFWDELVYRYQMGVQYVTWMRETWDALRAVRRRPPLRRGAGQARAPRGRRGRLARHERQLLARVQRPADPGRRRPLRGGDRRSAASGRRLRRVGRLVHDPRPGRRIAADHQGAHRPAARGTASSSRPTYPAGPSSRSRKADFFGPIVKNYVFEMSSR